MTTYLFTSSATGGHLSLKLKFNLTNFQEQIVISKKYIFWIVRVYFWIIKNSKAKESSSELSF